MSDTVVIVPTYNNAGTLKDVLERILAQGLPIIVVNDGSTDETASILGAFEGITVITHSKNQGKGYALKSGFIKARKEAYKYAITIDSDGQHYPEDIPLLLEKRGDNVLVTGCRPQMGADGKGSFANRFSNFWFRLYTGVNLPDTQTGFRLYCLDKLPSLSILSSRYEAELTLLVFSAWNGVNLVPVPVRVLYPEDRVSHFHPVKDFVRISLLNTILLFVAIFYGWPKRLLFFVNL